jgi:hypothetical protein
MKAKPRPLAPMVERRGRRSWLRGRSSLAPMEAPEHAEEQRQHKGRDAVQPRKRDATPASMVCGRRAPSRNRPVVMSRGSV